MKARVADLSRLRVKVGSLAPAPPEALVQTDTFFVVPRGRLKLREFSDGSGELIFYERPDLAGPKESLYVRCACSDPKAVSAVLGQALGVRGVVEKRRRSEERRVGKECRSPGAAYDRKNKRRGTDQGQDTAGNGTNCEEDETICD